jgi:predicted nucleotidyltransferase/DNA-binding HxlR family transcriptional regulator
MSSEFEHLIKTINYFNFFDYPPTFEEIYLFFPKRISQKELKKILQKAEEKKLVKKIIFDQKNPIRYTVGEYGIEIKNSKLKIQNYINKRRLIDSYRKKQVIALKKLRQWRFRVYLKLLSLLPQIKLIGLSGSLAMQNAKEDDDIDLFIITAKNRLWTARLVAVFLAIVLGLKRPRGVKKAPNRVCLNLFFDLADLAIPKQKRSEFVAHEVLQMKPLVDKDNTYIRFLQANRWVYRFFPNGSKINLKFKMQNSKFKFKIQNLKFLLIIFNLIIDSFELIFKKIQFYFIKKHRTTELITATQLWFHPEDFEKKVKV